MLIYILSKFLRFYFEEVSFPVIYSLTKYLQFS